MSSIRIMIASPSDVIEERNIAKEIISDLDSDFARLSGYSLDVFMWEVDTYPSFHNLGPQGKIDSLAKIDELDIFIGVFWSKLGTLLLNSNETGTAHEFKLAYEGWKKNKKPEIMTYFNIAPFFPKDSKAIDDLKMLIDFKEHIPKECLYKEYSGAAEFGRFFRRNIFVVVRDLLIKRGQLINLPEIKPKDLSEGKKTDRINVYDISDSAIDKILVPDSRNLYSSFQPGQKSKETCFYRLKIETTKGFIRTLQQMGGIVDSIEEREIPNFIYLIRDPIRPFEIQIGETRALRPGSSPGFLALEDGLTIDSIRRMYPFIVDENDTWLRTVFAELATTPDVLQFIYDKDPTEFVKQIASRNPRASNSLQQKSCLFCNSSFIEKRTVYGSSRNLTRIIHNDYPYGPYFHYIVMPRHPLHSWAEAEEKHFCDMNLSIVKFLNQEEDGKRINLNNAAGLRIGLNSSIRHLVLGKSTQSSAGASIPHVHKQMWGMSPGAVNLGDHLANICHHYSKIGIDYLRAYLDALRDINYIIWEDDFCALYIPFGQMSVHELQVMIKRRNTCNFLRLTDHEIYSLSKCEFIAAKIFEKIGINSFNELLISMPFEYENTDDGFRLILTFVTREVDIAVSELSLLYVVDKFPSDTLDEIKKKWNELKTQFDFNIDL